MPDLSQPGNFLTLLVSAIVLLKTFGGMNRYHTLRVFILTVIITWIVFYVFYCIDTSLHPPVEYPNDHFTLTEM